MYLLEIIVLCVDGKQLNADELETLFQDISSVALDRGFNDVEFDLLLQFFQKGNIGKLYFKQYLRLYYLIIISSYHNIDHK